MCKPPANEFYAKFESFPVYLCGRRPNRLANKYIELRLRDIASAFAFLSVIPWGMTDQKSNGKDDDGSNRAQQKEAAPRQPLSHDSR
jgi:hypothetical protein